MKLTKEQQQEIKDLQSIAIEEMFWDFVENKIIY